MSDNWKTVDKKPWAICAQNLGAGWKQVETSIYLEELESEVGNDRVFQQRNKAAIRCNSRGFVSLQTSSGFPMFCCTVQHQSHYGINI
jgi:hypothetical protein